MHKEYIDNLIIIRGAGEMASGVIHKLHIAGFNIIALEQTPPLCIRRHVCFASAFYEKEMLVEGLTSVLVDSIDNALSIIQNKKIALLIDSKADIIKKIKPMALIDGRMLKNESDTNTNMAPIVIGLGPGFTASVNCHAVIETNRGFNLGRALYSGSAEAHTGIPGAINNHTTQRVLRSPDNGIFEAASKITDTVKAGDIIGTVNSSKVIAQIEGIIRGLIYDRLQVTNNQKIGDIDPRNEIEYCFKISDKANAIAGGALEALMHLKNKPNTAE